MKPPLFPMEASFDLNFFTDVFGDTFSLFSNSSSDDFLFWKFMDAEDLRLRGCLRTRSDIKSNLKSKIEAPTNIDMLSLSFSERYYWKQACVKDGTISASLQETRSNGSFCYFESLKGDQFFNRNATSILPAVVIHVLVPRQWATKSFLGPLSFCNFNLASDHFPGLKAEVGLV